MAIGLTRDGDGRVSVGSAPGLDDHSAFTMWAVFRATGASSFGVAPRLLSKGDDVKDFTFGTNTKRMRMIVGRATSQLSSTCDVASTGDLSESTWYFAALTYDEAADASNHIYVATLTGSPLAGTVAPVDSMSELHGSGTTDADAANELWIGNRSTGTTNRAGDMEIARAGYAGKVLSLAEMQAIIDSGDLGAYHAGAWDIVDPDVTVTDASGNGNSGTAAGTYSTVAHPSLPALSTTGGDTTAPILSSPTGTATGDTTADGTVSTDEGNGTLYWVVTTSATAPSVAQVQAGQDHTGAAASDSGSQAVAASGVQNVAAAGLSPATAYYAHYQHQDAATNDSTVATSAQFTTQATVELAFSALRDQAGNALTATVRYRWYPDSGVAGTAEPGNLGGTEETGTFAATAGSGTLTGVASGAGWLELYHHDGTAWQTHAGRYTVN